MSKSLLSMPDSPADIGAVGSVCCGQCWSICVGIVSFMLLTSSFTTLFGNPFASTGSEKLGFPNSKTEPTSEKCVGVGVSVLFYVV